MKKAFALATPCTLDWNAMTPVDGGRFCNDCRKVVRNLSAMTEEEATALLRQPDRAELCVRYLHDRDGAVVFAPGTGKPDVTPASLVDRARRRAAAAFAAAAPFALAACGGADVESERAADAPANVVAAAVERALEGTPGDEDRRYTVSMGTAPVQNPWVSEDASADDADSGIDAAPSADAGTEDADTDGGDADGGDGGSESHI